MLDPPKVFESRCRAKEGSMVVSTVKDTRVAASSMLEGKPCGCTAEIAMASWTPLCG